MKTVLGDFAVAEVDEQDVILTVSHIDTQSEVDLQLEPGEARELAKELIAAADAASKR